MKKFALFVAVALTPLLAHATMSLGPWTPLFKGIDRAIGTNVPDGTFPRMQSVNVLRIDLTDPDVQLFPSPPVTNGFSPTAETYALSISNFVKRHGVAVATVANFYNTSQGTSPSIEGIPAQIFGLLITTGYVASVSDYGPDSNNRWASLLFTTNKEPIFAFNNAPPGVDTTGIFTAVSGYYPVLQDGSVLPDSYLQSAYPDPTVHNAQPRTVFGVSQDNRYLYLMTIDGRQSGYSAGAISSEMGVWMQIVGAWNAISMDGGGSTAMYMRDCVGNPQPLGRSSYYLQVEPDRERITGCQFGVFAVPLPSMISDVTAVPGTTSATVTWKTASNATTQVAYGLTTNPTTLTPYDPTLVTNHTVTISGLSPGRRYYYRVLSRVGNTEYSSSCGNASFTTTNFGAAVAYPLTANWKYYLQSLDGVNWKSPTYDDSSWTNGNGALWAYNANPPATATNAIPNFANGTRMPVNPANNYPYPTHYFRKSFVFTQDTAGVTLAFSNFVDDGAVMYLNGVEIWRTNMPPGTPTYNTYCTAQAPCGVNATCPLMFTVDAAAVNLRTGTNVVAVELHNFHTGTTPSADVTFESALHYALPPPVELPPFFTNVVVVAGESNAAIMWTTLSNASSQIHYGTTPALGSSTALDPTLTTNHAMALTGLQPVTQYFYRIVAVSGGATNTYDGTFSTVPYVVPVITWAKSWRFTTNNLSDVNWTAPGYDDSGWIGEGPALLYIEDNTDVTPRTTPLPLAGNGRPWPTYYFRTHFSISNSLAGFALIFTNHIDDGAIFYLNGVEIQRVRMAAGAPSYLTLANGCPPDACETSGDVPDLFRLSGDVLTNIVIGGDNVLAAEVHQQTTTSPDIVFGSAMAIVRALASETELRISRNGDSVCVEWDGTNLKLQHAQALTGDTNMWSDVSGAAGSRYCVTNAADSRFFRLR